MKWFEPATDQLVGWQRWLSDRPEHVRIVAERFNPWTLYRLTTTGQRASFLGCHEGAQNCGETDVDPMRVTVYLRVEHPVLGAISARNVFGIDPETLVPWTTSDEPSDAMPSTFGEERFE